MKKKPLKKKNNLSALNSGRNKNKLIFHKDKNIPITNASTTPLLTQSYKGYYLTDNVDRTNPPIEETQTGTGKKRKSKIIRF